MTSETAKSAKSAWDAWQPTNVNVTTNVNFLMVVSGYFTTRLNKLTRKEIKTSKSIKKHKKRKGNTGLWYRRAYTKFRTYYGYNNNVGGHFVRCYLPGRKGNTTEDKKITNELRMWQNSIYFSWNFGRNGGTKTVLSQTKEDAMKIIDKLKSAWAQGGIESLNECIRKIKSIFL